MLLAAATLLFVWGVAVALTGGLDVRVAGVAIRSRDPFRALVASFILFGGLGVVYRADLTSLLDRIAALAEQYARPLAFAAGLLLAAHAVTFGSFAVGGADPYGYVNQAYDWASGALPHPLALSHTLPFDTSDQMQAPLGYRVGPTPHTIVPTYAPGLPLLMALSLVAGKCGPFFVVPVFAVLFVWFTFRLGMLAGGPLTGLVAAIVLVTSPVVLYQVLWPMSDVPAGASWTAAMVCALAASRKHAAVAGVWAAAGLLLRPNLLLAPAAPLLVIVLETQRRERWIRAALFCLPIVLAAVFIAVLNTLWYGGPSNSGYGTPRELYLLSNVWPNVKLYLSWLVESQSWWSLLVVLPFVPPFSRSVERRIVAASALVAVLTFASYVSYSRFEVWWYLRFLMPAFGAFAVLVAAGAVAMARVVPQPSGRIAAAAAVCLMAATTLSFAAAAGVFGGVRDSERRYVDIGEFAGEHLPTNAALFAVQHGGSLRFYTGRLTLRFDSIHKERAAGVASAIERAGFHPYLIVDDFEIPQVRTVFGFEANAPLPWPIVARMRELGGVTIFDMATASGPIVPIALEPAKHHWCAARSRAPI